LGFLFIIISANCFYFPQNTSNQLQERFFPIPQPTKEQLDTEKNETGPYLIFTIKDEDGNTIRKMYKNASKGMHRINWDMRYGAIRPVRLSNDKFDPMKSGGTSLKALPGKYSVSMAMYYNGEIKELVGPVEFNTVVLNNTSLPDPNPAATKVFYKDVAELARVMYATMKYGDELAEKTAYIQQAMQYVDDAPLNLKEELKSIVLQLEDIEFLFEGTPAKASSEEVPPEAVPLGDRLNAIVWTSWSSSSAPTQSQKTNYDIVMEELPPILGELNDIKAKLTNMELELDKMKAPHTPGRVPKF